MANTVVATGLEFPEGPAFDRDGNLYVTEIQGGRISRIAPDGTVELFADTGGGPNGAAFGPDGALYVCNNGGDELGWVERIAPDGTITRLFTEVDGRPLTSPNDLAFDVHGNYYFTDPVPGRPEPGAPQTGSVCFVDSEGNAKRLVGDLAFPNGIGVTDDGKTLIVAESMTFKLHAFEIIEPGVLGEAREFGFLGDRNIPDGFAFDAAGNVLCCGFRSSQIHVFPPEGGEKIATVDFDDDRVTNVCFGGPNGATAFVTESGSGRVVSFEWERPGMALFPDR
jgi:gluconolactonase